MKIERKKKDEFQGLWQQNQNYQQQLEAPWHLAPHHPGTHGTRMQTCKSVSTQLSDSILAGRTALHSISWLGYFVRAIELSCQPALCRVS